MVKADGLAAGKGVVVADTAEEARAAVADALGGRFGAAGAQVLVEDRLTPRGLGAGHLRRHARHPLLPARDHKRRFDADAGPNTGGMGRSARPSA